MAESLAGAFHVGRRWEGHEIEDGCPCPKEKCGLIRLDKADQACDQHHWLHAKTMRQGHRATLCPGDDTVVRIDDPEALQ